MIEKLTRSELGEFAKLFDTYHIHMDQIYAASKATKKFNDLEDDVRYTILCGDQHEHRPVGIWAPYSGNIRFGATKEMPFDNAFIYLDDIMVRACVVNKSNTKSQINIITEKGEKKNKALIKVYSTIDSASREKFNLDIGRPAIDTMMIDEKYAQIEDAFHLITKGKVYLLHFEKPFSYTHAIFPKNFDSSHFKRL